MQTKISIIFNNIVRFLCLFCIFFIWINYYYPVFLPCVIISVIITSLLSYLLTRISYSRHDKIKITFEREQKINSLVLALEHLTHDELINYFYLVIVNQYDYAKKTKSNITINDKTVIPIFNHGLKIEDYLNCYRKNKKSKLVIITDYVTSELNDYLGKIEHSNIKIVTIQQFYTKFIEPTTILPIMSPTFIKPTKLKIKQLIAIALNKKNAKGYMLSGLFILLTSFFYGHNLYYQIIATILFLLSLFSLVNKKYNTINTEDIF